MEYVLSNAPPNALLIIGATGMEAIMQNIRMIILATEYSVPLDRSFTHAGEAVDTPSPHMTALYIANLIDTIEEKEPRIRVTSIRLATPNGIESAIDGKLRPIVTFHLKEGVTL